MINLEKYIHLLVQMLAIPSLSRKEDTRATFLKSWLEKEKLKVQRVKNNLIISDGSEPALASLLLNSHIDTVPPGEGWISDPFLPLLKDSRITGLGSNDAGASVVALIGAFQYLVEQGLSGGVVLLISAEEEVSGENGISSLLELLPEVKFALVGEPTGMQPAVAERGLMVVDGVATGLPGHAARGEGVNAIYKAFEDIAKIQSFEFPDHSNWLKDPSINVTMINAGSVHNMVPGKCDFVIDVRSNDRYSNERLLELLTESCASELKPRSMRLRSSYLDENHPVSALLKQLKLKPFGSPTLSDMALLKMPSIKMGPGDSARSHTANEFIYAHEINDAIEGYLTLIKEIKKLKL